MRAEIVAAFRHLVGPPQSAEALAPYVQGMNGALANVLASGSVNRQSDVSSLLPNGTMNVSGFHATSRSVATVDFTITYSNDNSDRRYPDRFVGTAVLTAGRWKASWVTVCVLVEQEGVVCPNPPPGVAAALPLPYSVTASQSASAQSPGLIRPGALALAPNGDLLVADSDRDQILEWHLNGTLTVFAGTGQHGFSGDGGPAIDAKLDGPGGMAFSPSGTLYFVDGNRVRAISPNSVITTVAGDGQTGSSSAGGPAIAASLDPSDVAVSPGGTLYIANGSAISEVSPNGILSTFVEGGPPAGSDVSTPSGPMAFFPQNIAFDGAGNLDVFSFSPKEIFQVSPSGTISLLGAGYTAQLTTAPNRDVFMANHGESIGRITGSDISQYLDLSSLKIKGLWFPGDEPGLEPNGIAVGPLGVIYLDSFNGSGWTGGTSLVEITPTGTAQALPIRTPILDTLPGLGSPGFSSSLYPLPTPALGSGIASCPSGEGLEPFNATAIGAARASARQFNAFTSSFYGDLQSSDKSWWRQLIEEWVGVGYNSDTHTVVSVQPATLDTFAGAVAHACGRKLVEDSLVIDVGPSAYSFQVSHLYFLNRGAHPLIYFQAS